MAPKKKKADDDGGDDGKKKNQPPTEVEREELRVQILALQERLIGSQKELEQALETYEESRAELAAQQREMKDVVAYLKKEIEKKDAEHASLERKYVTLTEEKEAEETRLNGALEASEQENKVLSAEKQKNGGELAWLKEQLVDLGKLKAKSDDDDRQLASQASELERLKAELQDTSSNLIIVAAPESGRVGPIGQGAVLLLLLEAMRRHSTKPVLQEQAMHAIQCVIANDQAGGEQVPPPELRRDPPPPRRPLPCVWPPLPPPPRARPRPLAPAPLSRGRARRTWMLCAAAASTLCSRRCASTAQWPPCRTPRADCSGSSPSSTSRRAPPSWKRAPCRSSCR